MEITFMFGFKLKRSSQTGRIVTNECIERGVESDAKIIDITPKPSRRKINAPAAYIITRTAIYAYRQASEGIYV
ncbi:hypothetical protein Ga0123461_1102 [Mariprofundus aestuarium]|uniref:Uncharacterized protein n=1 Tax=Mariprofundus aestuarium TaxID=1921086 RepID=A0A2K8L137_MARES|nr:hypothetical protein [Mariprofundus aestuarium]ATX79521.1 hypothetical protein Ga0123461_1102 [Mariprofundus aestuarium]